MHGLIFLNFKGKDVILMYLISEKKINFFYFFVFTTMKWKRNHLTLKSILFMIS
jgi:hypothetical protein